MPRKVRIVEVSPEHVSPKGHGASINALLFNPLTGEMLRHGAFLVFLAIAAKVRNVEPRSKARWKGQGKAFHPDLKKHMFTFEFLEKNAIEKVGILSKRSHMNQR